MALGGDDATRARVPLGGDDERQVTRGGCSHVSRPAIRDARGRGRRRRGRRGAPTRSRARRATGTERANRVPTGDKRSKTPQNPGSVSPGENMLRYTPCARARRVGTIGDWLVRLERPGAGDQLDAAMRADLSRGGPDAGRRRSIVESSDASPPAFDPGADVPNWTSRRDSRLARGRRGDCIFSARDRRRPPSTGT